MGTSKARLCVIEGRRDAPLRIALSLVHPRERIDIPLKDVLHVEACADETFYFPEIQIVKTYSMPHVRVDVAPHIGARIYRLTSQIIEQAMDIVIAGDVVCRPVVREPVGRPGLSISASDFNEAEALAAKLRRGWIVPHLRIV